MAGRPYAGQEKDRDAQISMRINADLKYRLAKESKRLAKPMSDIIHDAIENHLDCNLNAMRNELRELRYELNGPRR